MAQHSRPAVPIEVLINGVNNPYFQVLDIEHSHGGHRLDRAVLEFDLGRAGAVPGGIGHIGGNVGGFTVGAALQSNGMFTPGVDCEIVARVGGELVVWHYGKLEAEEIGVRNDETLRYVSRLDKKLFGVPLGFQRVYDPALTADTWTDAGGTPRGVYNEQHVIFNPEVEDRIVGNMRWPTAGSGGYSIFIHPYSIVTSNAAAYQANEFFGPGHSAKIKETEAGNWDFPRAIRYLCCECNGAETYIQNPTLAELTALFGESKAVLKNQAIRAGTYLPHCLDELLEPYGFSWTVDFSLGQRKIRVFKLGEGFPKQVYFQPPGAELGTVGLYTGGSNHQNVEGFEIDFDLSGVINEVGVFGSLTRVEGTWELIPAWPQDLDATDEEKLFSGDPDAPLEPKYKRVWRDWVLNEARDYSRPDYDSVSGNGTSPPNLTEAFRAAFGPNHPPVAARRRKFRPLLTLGTDGTKPVTHSGIQVSYWDLDKSGGAGWTVIPKGSADLGFDILKNECGITFTGDDIPIAIHDVYQRAQAAAGGDAAYGAKPRVRVTATIESDSRLSYTAPFTPGLSLAPEARAVVLDKRKSFHFRELVPSGPYQSEYFNLVLEGSGDEEPWKAKTADGREALQVFAEAMRRAWDQADCSGTIPLEGLDHDYDVSDVVLKIRGREIYLRLNADLENPRYPQIVGIRRYVQAQRTVLILESFRETDHYLGGLLERNRRII